MHVLLLTMSVHAAGAWEALAALTALYFILLHFASLHCTRLLLSSLHFSMVLQQLALPDAESWPERTDTFISLQLLQPTKQGQ